MKHIHLLFYCFLFALVSISAIKVDHAPLDAEDIGGDPEPILIVLNVSQVIRSEGYPAEEYYAVTPDGFRLNIVRIPYGKNDPNPKIGGKPVVFMQHGLLDSACTWVMNPPEQSLGYIMADAGFDVYLGNVRGNTWSMENIYLTQDDEDYWNLIDFDNMISQDLPSMIDKALEVSGQKSLIYIGHSQGTLMGFGGFPLNPELTAKVDLFIALAPVAYVSHVDSYLLQIMAELDVAMWLELFGFEDFLPSNQVIEMLGGTLCNDIPEACADVIFLLCGWDMGNLNMSRMSFYMEHTPAGTSVRNMVHWTQMVNSGMFEMYDYGKRFNPHYYNTSTPPQYYPQMMTLPPVAFYTGGKDVLADPTDVQLLLNALPTNNKPIIVHDEPSYEHLDFVWGMNAYQLIYPEIVQLAQQYSKVN